ncbi:hypothetical protein [Intrasporangium sp.]|uniref:hypothetical protein n=1 Tax=Intrasporangium sp. TaxID=1925024 RepID=UPI003221503B
MVAWLEAAGWLGVAMLLLVLLRPQLRPRLPVRSLTLLGWVLLALYAGFRHAWPVLGLAAVLALVELWRSVRATRTGRGAVFEVLGVDGDDEYLRHVLRVHEADIRTFNPGFVHDPFTDDICYLVLRGDETVGVVLMRDAGHRTAQIVLDYVTPRHRDLSPGESVFGPDGPFRKRGFRRMRVPQGMAAPDYERLGFRRDGDTFLL